MNIREALIKQSPSLELQRAAQSEIARLDALAFEQQRIIFTLRANIKRIASEAQTLLDNTEYQDGHAVGLTHDHEALQGSLQEWRLSQ